MMSGNMINPVPDFTEDVLVSHPAADMLSTMPFHHNARRGLSPIIFGPVISWKCTGLREQAAGNILGQWDNMVRKSGLYHRHDEQ